MNTIVLGTNHNNTLSLIWSLGMAGHKVVLLLYSQKHNYVDKSKYVDKVYYISHDDNVIDLLIRVSQELDSKPVVFVTNDRDATLLNEHYTELNDVCFFEGGKPDGSVNKYRDKDIEMALAKECGFELPKSQTIGSVNDLQTVKLDYPLFIKANNSTHGGKSAMHKCVTQTDANNFLSQLHPDFFPVQVQEFIEKEYEIMILGCSLYGGKKLICPIANRKIRQHPKMIGLGSYSESIDVSHNDDLRELSSRLAMYMQRIGYTGNFSAEFLYNKSHYYFLEVNLRNDGTSFLSTASGFNLPDMVSRSFIDGGVSTDRMSFKKMNYLNILADIPYVFNKAVSTKDWLHQFKSDTCYSHYNKNDKKVFWCYLKSLLYDKIENKYKKYIMNISNKIRQFFSYIWEPVFVEAKDGTAITDGKWKFTRLRGLPKDRCFADPFVLDANDKEIQLLVEEIRRKEPKGRIRKLVVDRQTLTIKEEVVLLEIETHLSFPAILRESRDIYVYPENAASGELSLYKYHQSAEYLEFEKKLSNQPLSDAVQFEKDGRHFLLATRKPYSNGSVAEIY